MKNLKQYTTEELIETFEHVRDELNLKSKTNHSKKTGVVYNTVSKRIKTGTLKTTEVDGTVYVSDRKEPCPYCDGFGLTETGESCDNCNGTGLL